jgi:glucose/arabinose dehydrogenase
MPALESPVASSLKRLNNLSLAKEKIAVAAGLSLFLFTAPTTFAETPSPPDACQVQIPAERRPSLELEMFATGLQFPVHLTHAGDGSGRVFVVELRGVIRVVKAGKVMLAPFLDIHDRVEWGGEKGLLSVAFHPNYKTNRRFFVNYTTRREGQLKTVIAEYKVSREDPDLADGRSERIVLEIDQPFDNHNGGLVLFGPDGFLYIGMGDGGFAGDPYGHGQNLETLLGALLRIDVDHGLIYSVPSDNPFVEKKKARPEIWAYGLRNPWRFSFDRCTGKLFVADVGQDLYEEVHLVEKGGNYGWNIMEGNHCFNPPEGCNQSGLTFPIAEYARPLGCSITGGHVYRGKKFPALVGHYFFSDFCSGRLWSLVPTSEGGWETAELLKTELMVSSFGEDEEGELYVLDYRGTIYHLKSKQDDAGERPNKEI